MVDDLCGKNETISGEFHRCDSDAVVHCTLNAMQDDAFSELFMLPPEKVNLGEWRFFSPIFGCIISQDSCFADQQWLQVDN